MPASALLRFSSVAVLLLAFAPVAGQAPVKPFYIGTVVDALRGHPLPGVEVTIGLPNNAAETTYTDGQGRFMISEAQWLRSLGIPIATVSAQPASGFPGGEGPSHRADGRALSVSTESVMPEYRSVSGGDVPFATAPRALAKQASVQGQGGPPFRFTKDGYACRESRMRILALTSSIGTFEGTPDYDLIIPLIPLRQEGVCPGP